MSLGTRRTGFYGRGATHWSIRSFNMLARIAAIMVSALTAATLAFAGVAGFAPYAHATKGSAAGPSVLPVTPTPYQSIVSTGPLTAISIGDELGCQVRFLGDRRYELYHPAMTPGDCGTFLAVGGALFAPNFKGHGGSEDCDRSDPSATCTGALGAYTPFTPVSQSARTGAGTTRRPWQIVTEVRAGTTGLLLREVDSYIARDAGYRTDVTITNEGVSAQAVVLYRAADCYLQESDFGFGFIGKSGSVACARTPDNRSPDRVEQWVSLGGEHHFIETYYADVWEAIGRKRSLPDTCRCGTEIDNGSGLSWYVALEPGTSARRSNLLSFSAQGVVGTLRSNDTTPPQIVIGDIPPSCTRTDVRLRISIFDANPVHHVRVFLDGRLIREPRSPVFRIDVPIDRIRVGGHRVRITATDGRGNIGVKSRVFSRCGAPTFVG
jgi:hypothetical protein